MELTQDRLNSRFKVVASLGTGEEGRVFLAKDNAHGDDLVAIKVLRQGSASSTEKKKRLIDKVTKIRTIDHPHLVKPIELVQDNNFNALVMEYVEGKDLRTFLEENDALTAQEVIELLFQISSGLEEVHGAGLVHGDLKPADALVTKEGLIKLNDCGLKPINEDEALSARIFRSGSAHYSAPELLKTGHCDCRGDIYSLGVIGLELLQRVPAAPEALYGVVRKAMAYEPSERYQSIADFKAGLAQTAKRLYQTVQINGFLFISAFTSFMLLVVGVLHLLTNYFAR